LIWLIAPIPSSWGMTMSMSTTSGWTWSTS